MKYKVYFFHKLRNAKAQPEHSGGMRLEIDGGFVRTFRNKVEMEKYINRLNGKVGA